MTVNTANAPHCYEITRRFQKKGSKVVFEGPHATLLPEEGRLLTHDWSYYNGKTRVAFRPKNMNQEELFEGYMWFRRNFYSLRSIVIRLTKSRANILYNLIVNLGYKASIRN